MKVLRYLSKSNLKHLKEQLVELLEHLGYRVVVGQGDFKDGACLIQQTQTVAINKFTPLDLQVEFLVRLLRQLDLSKVYVLPEIRRLLEEDNVLMR